MNVLTTPSADVPVLHMTGGDTLTVPGDGWLLQAEFVQQGPDLMLVGPNGEQALIPDFFNTDVQPNLATEGGSIIPADLAVKLAGPALPGHIAQAGPATATDPIGQVETISGSVEVTRADGTKVSLSQGSPIFSGDVVETGDTGAIGITLADDSTVSLADNGRMVMDELVYDADAEDGNAAISIVQGVFSYVSGQIAKAGPDAMVLRTPTATLGIRGTTIAGRAAPEGEESTISLLPDLDGQIGEVLVSNSAGTVVLNQAGSTATLFSAFQAPPPPVVVPVSQVLQQFSAALNSLPTPPAGTPSNAPGQGGQQGPGAGPEGEPGDGDGPPEGEGEGEQAEPSGDGELPPEGEVPPEELAALGEGEFTEGDLGPQVDGPPDGPGDGPQEGEGVPEEAFQEALDNGASLAEAFEAAARAAAEQILADGGTEEQAAAAIEAAEAAYQQAIANGLSPEQALEAAARAGDGALPEFNDGPGNGSETFSGGETQIASNDPGAIQIGNNGDNTFDSGSDFFGANDQFFDSNLNLIGDTFLTTDFFQPLVIDQFEPGFQQDFQQGDDGFINNTGGDENPDPVTLFDQIVTGTEGNDDLFAEDGDATQFVMRQGSTLGGNDDNIFGSAGVDELTLLDLHDIMFILDGTGAGGPFEGIADYSTKSSTNAYVTSGNLDVSSLDQIAATDGLTDISNATLDGDLSGSKNGDAIRLRFEPTDSGFGYIVAGNDDNADSDPNTVDETIDLSDPGTFASAYGLSHSLGGNSILGSIIFGRLGDDDITGTSSGDIIFGGSGFDDIKIGANDTGFGGAHDDEFTILDGTAASSDTGALVVGGSGNDKVFLSSGGLNFKFSIVDIEGVEGSTSDDTWTAEGTISGTTIDLKSGNDTLTLNSGANNTATIKNVNTINLAGGNDTITIEGSESVIVTGNGGNDTLTLDSSASHTVIFSASHNNGRDILNGFGSGDLLDVDGLGLNGIGNGLSSTTVEYITSNVPLSTGTNVVMLENNGSFFNGVNSADDFGTKFAAFKSFIDSSSLLSSATGGERILFALDDSDTSAKDLQLWHWNDADNDANVSAAEMTEVAVVDNTAVNAMSTSDFV